MGWQRLMYCSRLARLDQNFLRLARIAIIGPVFMDEAFHRAVAIRISERPSTLNQINCKEGLAYPNVQKTMMLGIATNYTWCPALGTAKESWLNEEEHGIRLRMKQSKEYALLNEEEQGTRPHGEMERVREEKESFAIVDGWRIWRL